MSTHRPTPPDSRATRVPLSTGHHAIVVVLGVILVSLCFGLLRIVDVAVSGALQRHPRVPVALQQPMPKSIELDDRSTSGAGDCVIGTVFEGVPSASVEAIDL